MKPEYVKIHHECLDLCRAYLTREAPIVLKLQEVESSKIYRALDFKTLFSYAVEMCGLSEGVAYSFIAVGKKAKIYRCLHEAIVGGTLSVSKANRIVSIMTPENAEELVEFAKRGTSSEIEREVRRRNPLKATPARIRPLSGDTDMLEAPIPRETSVQIMRAQTLLAQKTAKHQGLSETLSLVFDDYIERHDPLKKAQRAAAKNSAYAEKTGGATKPAPFMRKPLTAAEKHAVDLRDGRRCTHIGTNGARCNDDRWIHYHHIVSVAEGGTNQPENITTLCSFHHDLIHQMEFATEERVTWLGSPEREYRV